MNFDRRYALCVQKLYHRLHFTVGRSWNKSLHLQPLQRCYCANSGSPVSASFIRRHYSITQSLYAINGLLAVVQVGNLLCGFPSYLCVMYRERTSCLFMACCRDTSCLHKGYAQSMTSLYNGGSVRIFPSLHTPS